ncbi:MAG: hypothetical protein Q4B43_00225 [Bacteroidota bacterium]|nr:hypothetical protein [Bacteroidota bacterium]
MNRKILLFGLIISLLVNVFVYLYFNKNTPILDKDIHKEEVVPSTMSSALTDSLQNIIFEMSHYTLQGNDRAKEYHEQMLGDYDTEDIKNIKEALYELNHTKQWSDIEQFTKDEHFVISRAEVLNHKWILADFDSKNYSGQLLIKYTINQDKTHSFTIVDRALYVKYPK